MFYDFIVCKRKAVWFSVFQARNLQRNKNVLSQQYANMLQYVSFFVVKLFFFWKFFYSFFKWTGNFKRGVAGYSQLNKDDVHAPACKYGLLAIHDNWSGEDVASGLTSLWWQHQLCWGYPVSVTCLNSGSLGWSLEWKYRCSAVGSPVKSHLCLK